MRLQEEKIKFESKYGGIEEESVDLGVEADNERLVQMTYDTVPNDGMANDPVATATTTTTTVTIATDYTTVTATASSDHLLDRKP